MLRLVLGDGELVLEHVGPHLGHGGGGGAELALDLHRVASEIGELNILPRSRLEDGL